MANQHPAYTPAEQAWLRAHYATTTIAEAEAAHPTRTWRQLQCQALKLKLGGSRPAGGLVRLSWPATALEALDTLYPTGAAKAVAAVTGHTLAAVRLEAFRRGVAYLGKPKEPKSAKAVRAARPAAAPRPKAVAAPLLAVKRSAATPNLNVAKEARRQREEAPRRNAIITAEEVRKLPYSHPGRLAYTVNGQAGWQDWKQQQPR